MRGAAFWSIPVRKDNGLDKFRQGGEEPRRNQDGYLIAVCVGVAAFMVLLGLSFFLITNDDGSWKTVFSEQHQAESGDRQDDPAEERGKNDAYEPSPSDEYYKEITDALRGDLPYGIEWVESDLSRKQEDASFYALYPQLTGDIPNRKELNRSIEEAALAYRDYCQFAIEAAGFSTCHVQSFGYVTFMSEDVMSIVFDERIYLNETKLPEVCAINIDVRTGTLLSNQEMVSYTDTLTRKFRSQNSVQNGDKMDLAEWPDELIGQLLASEAGVVFYTPVGLEIGFNYSGTNGMSGWVTVTVKNYEQFLKKA